MARGGRKPEETIDSIDYVTSKAQPRSRFVAVPLGLVMALMGLLLTALLSMAVAVTVSMSIGAFLTDDAVPALRTLGLVLFLSVFFGTVARVCYRFFAKDLYYGAAHDSSSVDEVHYNPLRFVQYSRAGTYLIPRGISVMVWNRDPSRDRATWNSNR